MSSGSTLDLLHLALSHFVRPILPSGGDFQHREATKQSCFCSLRLKPAERSTIRSFGVSELMFEVVCLQLWQRAKCLQHWVVLWDEGQGTKLGVYILVALSGSFRFMYFYCCWQLEVLPLASHKTIFSSTDRPSWLKLLEKIEFKAPACALIWKVPSLPA